ncbi:hypothetical protein ACFGVS_10870 [Mucilaginibacter sp. AW1-7]|uniref:hypothetical protein n=1 Tax=Mucilaginibacter sp. AW1-7 TaxID=3349874 RepID=UPI003F73AA26
MKKAIALFMLFTLVNQFLTPSIAYALTAGPTAPEATNFEPIDTTDMVNPLTGTFTYGMPLLEVPGPEGGYPLALSYHAGIQPNEEASWVGLGWSLNPGAIARNVNGYPDDWSSAIGCASNYWDGGVQSTNSYGITLGLGGSPASVSFGLSFSQDTYRGFGFGASLGVGVSLGSGSPFGLGVQVGVSPYGGGYVGANVNYSPGTNVNGGLNGSLSIGVQTNFHSVDASISGGISASKTPESPSVSSSLLGASIRTSNIKPSFSVGAMAASSANDSQKGERSTSTDESSTFIPIYAGVSISLGYKNVRYWSNTFSNFTANGVLNNHSAINSTDDLNTTDDDNYSLPDPNISIVDNPDPRAQLGGTYPSFDNYTVTAQGLGGNMRPYAFATVLFHQNRINNTDHSKDIYGESLPSDYTPTSVGKKWQFRFVNDLSNSYQSGRSWSTDQRYNFGNNTKYGNNDGDYGYDQSTNRLEGTNHIEYFTNDEIADPSPTSKAHLRGFIDCDAAGFNRPTSPQNSSYTDIKKLGKQIGGFMITNASGVTYHYALPAYESQEFVHTEKIDATGHYTGNELSKPIQYAYTWYLTAITGPDYVPRGTLTGKIDIQHDWGYFVKFDYGMWTNGYDWSNPSEGFIRDIDNQYQSYSIGQKEIYYLDAIETRSHTALFEKEIRADAKGTFNLTTNAFAVPNSRIVGYKPTAYNVSSVNDVYHYPRASLRLNNIYLFQNDQLATNINSIRQNSTNYLHAFNAGNDDTAWIDTVHNGLNVIDKFDITANLASKCLRKIAFNYDYSLSQGCPNSYDPGGLNTYIAHPSINGSTSPTLLGKLTLLSVDFQGKGGVSMTPPTQFQYDVDASAPANNDNITITNAPVNQPGINQLGGIRVTTPGKFKTGDIITFVINSTTYYCTLISTTDQTNFNVFFLNNSPGTSSINTVQTGRKTKNPPYNADASDIWGCYKSDYKANPSNENISRMTSQVSNLNTDVWSMRKIVSTLGSSIGINYEGADYGKSALTKNRSLVLLGGQNNIINNGNRNYTFTVDPNSPDLRSIYKIGDKASLIYMFLSYVNNDVETVNTDSQSTPPIVTAVTSNTITLKVSAEMDNDLYRGSEVFYTGNIIANGSNLIAGGGIRVKSLVVDDLNGNISKTAYDYSIPGFPSGQQSSSGVTAYEPYGFEPDNTAAVQSALGNTYGDVQKPYRRELYKLANKLLSISRELPSPGVMYEYVTVGDSSVLANGSIPVGGKTVYQYEVFKPEMIGIYDYNDLNGIQPASGSGPAISSITTTITGQAKKDRTIKDYTSRVGNLKRIITYDNLNNKLTEKINHYLYDDLDNTPFINQINNYEPRLSGYNGVTYNNMGVIKERYGNSRFIVNNIKTDYSYHTTVYEGSSFLMMSNKETFPTFQTGTTQIDYKNGTRMDETNLAYDFYTGAVTKTLTKDSYGNRFISQVTPAYMVGNGSVYPALGLKTHDDIPNAVQHKQMLSQQASKYTFSVDANNNPIGVISASVQTWSNTVPVLDPDGNVTTTGQSGIWRMESIYSWLKSGTSANNMTPYSAFVDYFSGTDASWKKTSQITQYNVYSAALEATDINNNYAATRMGYNSSKVLFTGGAARYNEIAYAGAEDAVLTNGNFSNNISPGGGTVVNDSTKSHTGVNSLMVPVNTNGFTYTVPITKINAAGNYSVAVWVKPPPAGSVSQASLYYQVNGGTVVTPAQSLAKSAAGRYLLEITVPAAALAGNTGSLVVGCKNGSLNTLYFDDFRFQPTAASATAYVYDNQTGELTYILNNNNLFVRFQYDAVGRLVRTYREVLGKATIPLISSQRYHYARNGNVN